MFILDGKRVNDEVAGRDFKYYVFDWDDNILHMPTRIYMERRAGDGTWRPVAVTTTAYALARMDKGNYRWPSEGGYAAAFRDFEDVSGHVGPQAFIRDTQEALNRIKNGERPGPSFEILRKTLREGRLFAIITARGHAPETIRTAVRLFVDQMLTPADHAEMLANLRGYRWFLDKQRTFGTDEEELDYYLSACRYHAVMCPSFQERLLADEDFGTRFTQVPPAQRPDIAKTFALRDFVDHLIHTLDRTGGLELRHPMSIGFSDDDPNNVKVISEYIRAELARRYGAVKFVVYDTSDPEMASGRKVTVAGQLDLPGF